MWSGNAQMSGGSFPTQWALNPAAYVNMPNEQVDWASLAQQWIKMKESQPEAAVTEASDNPQAPPPPIISAPTPAAIAPQQAFYPVHQEADVTSNTGAWGWGWDGGGGSASGGGWTGSGWEQSSAVAVPADVAPYRDSMQAGHSASAAQNYGPAYHENVAWSAPGSGGPPGGSGRKDWRKHRHQPQHHSQHHSPQPVPQPQIDAVKRKQLPAWIREGLEKMEREKLKKQQEEGRQLDDHLSPFVVNGSPVVAAEESDADGSAMPLSPVAATSRFEDERLEDKEDAMRKSIDRSPAHVSSRPSNIPPASLPTPKSKEEIFQSVMAGVGRILTQLLMEVTNETVMQTVSQVLQRNKIKGLRIYDSDDSGSDAELDSEHQIKARIRKRQEEFSRRENEIEKEIEEQEEREKRVLFGREANTDAGAASSSSSETEEDKASTPPHPPPTRLATPPSQPPVASHSNHRHRSKSGSNAREKESSDGRERRRIRRHSANRRRRHSSDSSSGSRRRRTRSRSRDRRSKHSHSSRHRHKHHRSRSTSSSSSSSASSRHRHRHRHSHRSSRR